MKPQIFKSHELENIPTDRAEDAVMTSCEDCDGTGVDHYSPHEGFDRAFACQACMGHGVVWVLYPVATIPALVGFGAPSKPAGVACIGNGLFVRTGRRA